MAYRVILSPAAQRPFDRLHGVALIAIGGVIVALADDPRPAGALELVGRTDLWRLGVRVDGRPWRILYRVRDQDRSVVVARIARRDEATYRGM